MKRKFAGLFLTFIAIQACVSAPDYSEFGGPGAFNVETESGVWKYPDRKNRRVPWKLFLPVAAATPSPVIIVSPGGGGSRDDPLNYIGEHLASYGFAVFQLQHEGSDVDAFFQAPNPNILMQQIRDSEPRNATLRQQDIQFAVDRIELMSTQEFAGRLNGSRVGLIGFSFGAVTALVSAGMELPESGHSLAEPRLKAVLALSPSARYGIAEPLLTEDAARRAYSNMLVPIFHMRGTEDVTPLTGVTNGIQRELPFRVIDSVDQYLLVLNGAEHPTFGGATVKFPHNPALRAPFDYPDLARHRELIRMAAAVFWRAYLADDQNALQWLTGGGLASELGQSGSFESKTAQH